MRPNDSPRPHRSGNERTVSVRLKPGHRRWLERLASRAQSSPGRLALVALEQAIESRARELLEADMAAELATFGDPPTANTPPSPDDLDAINQEAAP